MELLENTQRRITARSEEWAQHAHQRLASLTMPYWALGRVLDLAEELAAMTRSMSPPVSRKAVAVMAGDHGVTAEGVSRYPSEVTRQMVLNFLHGGAAINALARQANAEVYVVDMGIAEPLNNYSDNAKLISHRIAAGTGNIAKEPAMTREQAIASIEAGIETASYLGAETDIFATGDMGIGNTTPSTGVLAALTGASVEDITGRGTGLEDDQLAHKTSVIKRALQHNSPDAHDPVDVLAKVGGFEIGGIAGLILGAAAQQKPVLLDGFISTAGALLAKNLKREAADYMIAAHRSVEQGHTAMHEDLGKLPLLDLQLRLGEGTGAALAMSLVDAAACALTDIATFEEAAVSEETG